MATNFRFGLSNEDIEKEEAQRLREYEAKIQQRAQERNRKLEELNKRTKRNRRIVISVFTVFFIAMLVFGTYNTFFKKILTEEDVQKIASVSNAQFDLSGVEGFLHESTEELFLNYVVETNNHELEYYKIDPNSIRVSRILPFSQELAAVYFNANLDSKKNNTTKDDGDKKEEVIGESSYNTHQFRIILQYTGKGYLMVSDLELQPQLLSSNYTEIQENDTLSFEELEEVEPERNTQIQLKVERILADLYNGRDVGSDYDGNPFKEGYTFVETNEFQAYKDDNPLGFNAVIKYTVNTEDGLTFTNTAYLKIKKVAEDNWKIEKFL